VQDGGGPLCEARAGGPSARGASFKSGQERWAVLAVGPRRLGKPPQADLGNPHAVVDVATFQDPTPPCRPFPNNYLTK
jgi:hypothetical protein